MAERRTLDLSRGEGRALLPLDESGRVRSRVVLSERSMQRSADGVGFKGRALSFNKRTMIGRSFWEEIAPGAVTKTLREADVRLLVNHDANLLLARSSSGTLRLSADKSGLNVEADIAPTSYGSDVAVLLERGDISEMSFAFEPLQWTETRAEDGKPLFTITEMRLYDVSIVTFPAYGDGATSAALRSANSAPARYATRMAIAGETSYADRIAAICEALATACGVSEWAIYVADAGDAWAVYYVWDGEDWDGLWLVSWAIDANGVTLGTPESVVATYVPAASAEAGATISEPDDSTRAAAPAEATQRIATPGDDLRAARLRALSRQFDRGTQPLMKGA